VGTNLGSYSAAATITAASINDDLDELEGWCTRTSVIGDLTQSQWVTSPYLYKPDFFAGPISRSVGIVNEIHYSTIGFDVHARSFHHLDSGSGTEASEDGWLPIWGTVRNFYVTEDGVDVTYGCCVYVWEAGGGGDGQMAVGSGSFTWNSGVTAAEQAGQQVAEVCLFVNGSQEHGTMRRVFGGTKHNLLLTRKNLPFIWKVRGSLSEGENTIDVRIRLINDQTVDPKHVSAAGRSTVLHIHHK